MLVTTFSFFPKCFKEASLSGLLKVGIVWYRVKITLRSVILGPFDLKV